MSTSFPRAPVLELSRSRHRIRPAQKPKLKPVTPEPTTLYRTSCHHRRKRTENRHPLPVDGIEYDKATFVFTHQPQCLRRATGLDPSAAGERTDGQLFLRARPP